MNNWLITGGAGFVGSHLVADLHRHHPDHMTAVLAPTRRELDLADRGAVADVLRRHHITGVVHLAACLDRSETHDAEARQWLDTFEAGRTVISQATARGVRHMVIAGTIEELGDHDGILNTDLVARPQTLYSLCKTLLREYAEYTTRRSPMRIDWFRPFVVYGPGQRGDMLLPSAFHAAVTGHPCDFSDGTQARDFLFIDDLVRWIRYATTLPSEGGRFHVHHVGTGAAVPVRDVLEMIREEFPGAPFRIGARPRRPGEPMVQRAPRHTSAESAIEPWHARVELREGVRRTAAWWRQEAMHS